jgi:6-pyruvoyltetrahydropterin/6-carboxytetrahydropterin synthase
MYILEKQFSFPAGHRLSKNKSLCSNVHGHNFDIIVSVKSEKLNSEDMVIDFSELKKIVNKYIESFDHCLMLNKEDSFFYNVLKDKSERVILFNSDPTAESLARYLYKKIEEEIINLGIEMNFVKIFENKNSSVIYQE